MARMTQAELDALLGQAGGGRMVHSSTVGKQKITNPAHKAGGGTSYTVPEELELDVEQWQSPEGHTIRAYHLPDGSWEVTQNQPPTRPTSTATTERGQTAQVEGTPDPSKPDGFDNQRPRMVTRAADGTLISARPLTTAERTQWEQETGQGQPTKGETRLPDKEHPGYIIVTTTTKDAQGNAQQTSHYEKEGAPGVTVPAPTAPPQVVPGTLNTTSPRYAVQDTQTGTLTWIDNPNHQKPDPKPITIPGNPRVIYWDDGNGQLRKEKNPDYVKPSKIQPHPSDPRRMINITEDDDGNPIILPVNDQTVIKPADLPVLQATYGQISQELGRLAQELNGKYARGEITYEERQQAFQAAHQQAQTQVAEINGIMDASRSAWATGITQRGQTLTETQSRRSFADSMFRNAGSQAADLVRLGAGAKAGPAFTDMLRMGQAYAAGMGGFRESAELPMPVSLQQVQGIGIPGYPLPSGPGSAPAGPASRVPMEATPAGGARLPWDPSSAPGPVGPGAPPNALGLGAIGDLPAPGSAPPVPAPPSGPAAATRPWTDPYSGPSIVPPSGADLAAATQAQSAAAFGGLGIPPVGAPPGRPPGVQTQPYLPGTRGSQEVRPGGAPGLPGVPSPPAVFEPQPYHPSTQGPPVFEPQPYRPTPGAGLGIDRMGAQLGAGLFDPMQAMSGMLAGREDDPIWQAAVRRAMGGYGRFA